MQPWSFFIPLLVVDEEVGDLEFLAGKQVAGDLVVLEGSRARNSVGSIVSFVPATGKTFFIVDSQIQGINFSQAIVEVVNDVTSRGKYASDTTFVPLRDFIVKSDGLIGDASKNYSIDITTAASAGTVPINATLEGWIQDT